jgi:hypothetical protein
MAAVVQQPAAAAVAAAQEAADAAAALAAQEAADAAAALAAAADNAMDIDRAVTKRSRELRFQEARRPRVGAADRRGGAQPPSPVRTQSAMAHLPPFGAFSGSSSGVDDDGYQLVLSKKGRRARRSDDGGPSR